MSFYQFNCNQFILKTYRKLIRRVFLRLLLVLFLFWPFDHNFSRTRSWTPLVSLLSFRQYQHHGKLENHNFINHMDYIINSIWYDLKFLTYYWLRVFHFSSCQGFVGIESMQIRRSWFVYYHSNQSLEDFFDILLDQTCLEYRSRQEHHDMIILYLVRCFLLQFFERVPWYLVVLVFKKCD